MIRAGGRAASALRAVSMTRHFTKHAEGSVLVCFGDTQVLCTASVEARVPPFLHNTKRGWVTAEYAMLPRATHTRSRRAESQGKPAGRTIEIQRLIGRTLRAAIDASQLGERTIFIDCDVLQADGGTRCAAITGAYVALADAVAQLLTKNKISTSPLQRAVAAVSVGVVNGAVITDLDYDEDSTAQTDMNVVMDEHGGLIELQGTAEGAPFSRAMLTTMLDQAATACTALFAIQRAVLAEQRD